MYHLVSLDEICIIWYLSMIYVSPGISQWYMCHLGSLDDILSCSWIYGHLESNVVTKVLVISKRLEQQKIEIWATEKWNLMNIMRDMRYMSTNRCPYVYEQDRIIWDLPIIYVSSGFFRWCMYHLGSLDDICIIWILSMIYVSSGFSRWYMYHLDSLNDICIILVHSRIYMKSGISLWYIWNLGSMIYIF